MAKRKQVLSIEESRKLVNSGAHKKKSGKTWNDVVKAKELEAEQLKKETINYAKKGDSLRVTFTDKCIGMNEMKSNHWRVFKPKYDKVKKKLKQLIKEKPFLKFTEMEIVLFHNTKFDTGNLSAMEKPFTDLLVEMDYIFDDAPKYVPNVLKMYAKDLPKGTVIFEARELIGNNLAA